MSPVLAFLLGACAMLGLALIREQRRRQREQATLRLFAEDFRNALAGQRGDLFRTEETALAALADELTKGVEALARQEERTAQAKSRLAKGMADLAHQLKTPIASLRLLSELRPADDIALAESRQLDRLETLVQGLLTLARVDAGTLPLQITRLNGADIAEDAIHALTPLLQDRQQEIRCHVDMNLTWQGDARWSTEILINLLKNASDATPIGGTVHLTGKNAAPLYIAWLIKDEGPGIAPEDQGHLFERFYRGKHAREDGVGIGLSLARELAIYQGGSLDAANDPHGGAVFTLRFYQH